MKYTHRMTNSPEYQAWRNIIQRCGNPKCRMYHRYGQRGIEICKAWKNSFETFFKDVGARPSATHSIDRINVNGDYEPGNVRWATRIEQQQNMECNVFWNHGGERLCAAEWSRRVGITPGAMAKRIHRNLPPEEMLEKPLKKPSHLVGIFFHSRMRKWQVRISGTHIGTFLSEQEAISARERAVA